MDEDDSDSSFNSERDGESSVEGSGDDDFIQLDTTLGKKCFRDGVLNSDLSPVYVVLLIFLILSLCKKVISVSPFCLCHPSESRQHTWVSKNKKLLTIVQWNNNSFVKW